MTWDAELQQLCYAPLAEQAALRGAALAAQSGVRLAAGAAHVLGPWGGSVGNQSEVVATFALPAAAATFGIVVMGDADPRASGTTAYKYSRYTSTPPLCRRHKARWNVVTGTLFFVDFTPPVADQPWPRTVTVGAMSNRSAASSEPWSCAAAGVVCANDTLQVPSHRLTASSLIASPPHPSQLTARDANVTLRAFVDNNFAECYWQGGRVATTAPAPPTTEARTRRRRFMPLRPLARSFTPPPAGCSSQASVALVSTAALLVPRVDAWRVGSIWVSEEQLLRTPRPDATRS